MNKSNKNIMARGYDKKEALQHMRKLRSLVELAESLTYFNIRKIAKAFNVSFQTLYNDWEKETGEKYGKNLKLEISIRNKSNSNVGKKKLH